MEDYIRDIRKQGDTWNCNLCNSKCTFRTGEPVFDKLHAELGKAMLSINAVKDLNLEVVLMDQMKGSEHNDLFNANGSTRTIFQEAYKAELAMVWIFISELLLSPLPQLCKNKNH
jgi:chorismate synthase